MSTVFLAIDTVLERQVAVKLLAEHLADDEVFVQRFRHEALAAARLQHPNIVQVFDSGKDEQSHRHYIVMEYVDGPSCSDLLREHGQLGIEDTVRIVVEACHGLDYAHRAGVVHRDVKPGNLLISNETGAVKLADFGIAKAAEQTRVTQVGSVLGTAAYLSPEQAQGKEAGPASDIYSLGVCAYQLLTGRLPYEYSSLTELALKQQNEGFEPIRRFRREARAVSRLRHPNVVGIHDVGVIEGVNYFSMDYVEGLTLDQAVTTESLTHRELAEIFVKVCDAVDYAHHQGIVHRDLKPRNILVDKKREPTVIDFGIDRKSVV